MAETHTCDFTERDGIRCGQIAMCRIYMSISQVYGTDGKKIRGYHGAKGGVDLCPSHFETMHDRYPSLYDRSMWIREIHEAHVASATRS